MDILQALHIGVYGFFVTLGFIGAAGIVFLAVGLIATIFKRLGGNDCGE